ncbi:maleylpyruvate isomerase family mycothiol-dependent enzyme [Nocardioides guangzhouensis]|uniref:Maleylpyruvate isomerase family mycothiol-dependent enzyme n=1 Tax=Nocardioides guangzhouensis TaxID=2497878 RepID=A0A4Q4ZD47_9ACTN|nr:maleylpyruvate isomerase family mycothiol-dependent enzyme [Nocardioides guangzhouensis]RYP85545.1 maleylpyruvate isomerase family mycothiol-dependent enzyme [Nocardioides guangzhouensis]
MDHAQLWKHIHTERAVLAATLTGLSDEQWEHDTLCPGWTVKDVAAHVISTPQTGWRQMPGMLLRNLGRGYNTMIFREVRRLGERETRESILADFERFATSTHHVPTTTSVEPLIDALLHHQDIVRPLGLRRDMPPEAAAVAADRARLLWSLMGNRRVVRGTRMSATDIDWVRGSGPTIEGPVQELLMLCSGRSPDPDLVGGDGLALLATG